MKKTSEFIHIHKVCSWLQVIRKRYNLSISQPYVHFKSSNFLFSYTPAERKHDHFRNRWEMPSSGQLTLTRHVALCVVGGLQSSVTNLCFSLNKLGLLLDYPSRLILRCTQITQLKTIFIFGLTHFLSLLGGAAVMLASITDPKLPPHCIWFPQVIVFIVVPLGEP